MATIKRTAHPQQRHPRGRLTVRYGSDARGSNDAPATHP